MADGEKAAEKFNAVTGAVTGDKQGVFLPRIDHIRHLIESGALVYTWLDLETTDKDWKTAEITVASLTTTDIGYNLVSDELFEVAVPDRVGLSPEAMLITRYTADKVRDRQRMSPQNAAAAIFESVQNAPRRLWNTLGSWDDKLGVALWQEYVDERTLILNGDTDKPKEIRVRHIPALDADNKVVKHIRLHEPRDDLGYVEMSYLAARGEKFDYEDEAGKWRIREVDKYNLGFRNTFFDNRLMAAALFRANFPLKEIYALNRKGLGNHAADMFTAALASHFFGTKGRQDIKLGKSADPETDREKISAKLDLIMSGNQAFEDPDVDMPPGIRVYDGTLHNLKRGHNQPEYDNAKAIGLHRHIRHSDPELMAHVEKCGQIDWFRDFMTRDTEDGQITTHPLRAAVVSAGDDTVYRAVPLIVLGSDDRHGKFNKIWTMRADMDYRTCTVDGVRLLEMDANRLAQLIREQRGRADAIFQEIHLKRHRGVVDIETGLKAGCAPGKTLEELRRARDTVVEYLDERDASFIDKALDAFALQYSFGPPADDVPQPYPEEEIWTAMGDVKYPFVDVGDGKTVRLPRIIQDMAQKEFKRLNDQIGDTLRSLMRPQKLDLEFTRENAVKYMLLRKDVKKKLEKYQADMGAEDRIVLPTPFYAEALMGVKTREFISTNDILATMIQDQLYLMDKIPDTTRSYDVEQRMDVDAGQKPRWQRIPFEVLAKIPESRLINLRDDGRLRVRFERNPNRPSYRFAIRSFIENGLEEALDQKHRDFYRDETASCVHGPSYIPDPDRHRIMTAPRVRAAIERIRGNVRQGRTHVVASRPEETGAYEKFAANDFAEAVLNSVEEDVTRRERRYPNTEKRQFRFGVDPATGRPLLNVKYEIPKEHLVVKIPDTHAQTPISHATFGHTCIVVPAVKGIEKAAHIVLEEEKSGRRYYAAEHVLHKLPPRAQGGFGDFYKDIDNMHARTGHASPQEGYVISCAEIPPVSVMNEPSCPSVRIDQAKLLATRAPRLASLQRDEVLTGFIVRKYDLTLKENQRIRLRGADGKGKDTGWEAMAKVSGKPAALVLKDVVAMIDDPARAAAADTMAWECGFGNAADMKAHLLSEFTKFDEDVNSPDNVLLFFRINPVNVIHHWTEKQPRSCYERVLAIPGTKKRKPAAEEKAAPVVALPSPDPGT